MMIPCDLPRIFFSVWARWSFFFFMNLVICFLRQLACYLYCHRDLARFIKIIYDHYKDRRVCSTTIEVRSPMSDREAAYFQANSHFVGSHTSKSLYIEVSTRFMVHGFRRRPGSSHSRIHMILWIPNLCTLHSATAMGLSIAWSSRCTESSQSKQFLNHAYVHVSGSPSSWRGIALNLLSIYSINERTDSLLLNVPNSDTS